jgi:dipicolinic acid synthetase, B subunit
MSKIGFAITGSFCTFSETLKVMRQLVEVGYELTPVLSFAAASLDTRFFKADNFIAEVEKLSGKKPITTIVEAEPLGTRDKHDLILVSPCTGNSLAKIANGITDTPVTMAVKAHLRNCRPVLLSLSSNDALGANARNLGTLLNTKNVYFVPFGQDNPELKTKSLIANVALTLPAIEAALSRKQLQPLFCRI